MRRLAAAALIVLAVVAVAASAVAGRGSSAPLNAARPVLLNRVAVLVLENRSWGQVIGNPSAPFLNSLARRGALATHYYAIAHPSLPNYLALTTGGYAHVTRDCARCASDGRSLVSQLDTAGISWRAYFESLPRRLSSPYSRLSAYNRHYNPFVYT